MGGLIEKDVKCFKAGLFWITQFDNLLKRSIAMSNFLKYKYD